MTRRRTAVVLAWTAVVAALLAGGAVAATGADATATSNHTNATVDDVVSSDGAVVVRLANATGVGTVNVTVTSADGGTSAVYTRAVTRQNGAAVARVAPGALPTTDLDPASVSVSVGGREIHSERLSLDYVVLDPNAARLRSDGTAVVGTLTSVGTDPVTLRLVGDDSQVQTATATRRNGTLRLARGAVRQYLLPPRSFRVDGPADGESTDVVANGVRLDPRRLGDAGNATITTGEQTLTLSSPALVDNETYAVTVRADGRYTTTATASDGSLTVRNPALLEVASVNVTVAYDGVSVVTVRDYRLHEAVTATVVASTNVSTTLNLTAGALPSAATVTDARVVGDERAVTVNASRVAGEDVVLDGVSLSQGAGYRVYLRTQERGTVPVRVGDTVDGEIQTPAPAAGGGGSGGGSGGLGGSPLMLGGVGVVVVLLAAAGFLVLQSDALSGPSGGGGGGGGGGSERMRELEVTIRDPDGSVHDGPVEVNYEEERTLDNGGRSNRRQASRVGRNEAAGGRGLERGTETVTGTATLRLSPTAWELTVSDPLSVRGGGVRVDPERDDSVELELRPEDRRLRVVDETGEPVDGVTVTVDDERQETGADGVVRLRRPPGERRAHVRTDHPVYENADRTVRWTDDGPTDLRLDVDSGGLAATATVDGEPTDGIEITVARADDRAVADDPRTGETDADGRVDFSGLVVGEYTVTATAGEAFETDERTVSVAVDRTEPVDLELSFGYMLSGDHDRRLSTLRDATGELRPSQQLDGAVHHYYGTVIESLADVIAGLPDAGHRFVGSQTEPAALTAALLDVGEELLDLTRVALNDKRNVDLFTACADMQAVRTDWSGDYEEAALFEALTDEPGRLVRGLGDRLDETDEFLRRHRNEVTVDSPVREPYAEVDSYVRSAADPVPGLARAAALSFAVRGYLGAVEGVFDEPTLRERLDSTVY